VRIILGVTGGIAAYKAALLLRLLKEAGHLVRVIPTESALKFVGAPTWEALSGETVSTSVFDDVPGVAHVALGASADLVIVAPATADILARAASGRADDLLTATLLVATCPVVMAPAMHTQMWQHPATQHNVAVLRERGVLVIEPDSGRLTGADSGPGRLPDPERIADVALAFATEQQSSASGERPSTYSITDGSSSAADLPSSFCAAAPAADAESQSHPTLVVTAGGTREPIDPVRWIGNRSSGKQGVAIAAAGAERGMAVTLIAANIDQSELAPVVGNPLINIVPVETCAQLQEAVQRVQRSAGIIVMAAAVADYRPADAAATKLKKLPGIAIRSIELVENPDILAELCQQRRPGQVIVGFAAETGDDASSVLDFGRAKAIRKGADLLVVNDVSAGKGFGAETNQVWLLDSAGNTLSETAGTKRQVADAILDAALARSDAP